MEGYLNLWTNIFTGWTPCYAILYSDILAILDEKGGKRKATVSLKIATVKSIPEDSLRIVIDTGTNELHLRAANQKDKSRWEEALISTQKELVIQESISLRTEFFTDKKASFESPRSQRLLDESHISNIDKKLAEVWSMQANFDEASNLLEPELKKNPKLASIVDKLVDLGKGLKYSITECAQDLEREHLRVSTVLTEFNTHRDYNKLTESIARGPLTFTNEDNELHMYEEEKLSDEAEGTTEFHSFSLDEAGEINTENECNVYEVVDGKSRIVKEERKVPPLINHQDSAELLEEDNELSIHPSSRRKELDHSATGRKNSFLLNLESPRINHKIHNHPVVRYLFEKNPAFKDVELPIEDVRECLPHMTDANAKISLEQIWRLIKECIGKDIFRFTMPVWLNEPLGVLQRVCETLEYHDILLKANDARDSCLRLAYVCAFAISSLGSTINRTKKPFNPLLGETFEYLPMDGSYRFIAEQVSHHPPISAAYAEGSAFKYWINSAAVTSFKGNSLEVRFLNPVFIVLNRYNDHITFKRPTMVYSNIIVGKPHVQYYGNIRFRNSKTGDTAVLSLEKRGWSKKNAYDVQGSVSDGQGNLRYKIEGKWDSQFSIIEAETGKEVFVWQKLPPFQNQSAYYNFTYFALQMNHISHAMLQKMAPTDTRFRPDQRLYERGDIKGAASEKNRLEEKQRAVRRFNERLGRPHKPKWFKESVDSITQEKKYDYVGGYWETRKKGDFSDVFDIYSDE
mgnify:FL=1